MPWTGSPGQQSFLRTDGTRTGALTWQEADASGIDIVAPDHDLHDQDLADAISSCLKNDGGNSATSDIPMGGFRFKNVGQANAGGDSIRASDVQDNRTSYCTVSGTANEIKLTNSIPITTYRAGQEFRFQALLANTGSVTINVDGKGAKALKVADVALSAGQILAGAWITIAFDGVDFEMAIGTTPSTVSVGVIMAWPMSTVPAGWLECDGSAISRTTYAALFGVVGTSYGPGNGTTTFNLPNYKNQFLRGFDASGTDAADRTNRGDGTTGAFVGTKQTGQVESHAHTFTGASVADHKHFVSSTNDNQDTSGGGNRLTADKQIASRVGGGGDFSYQLAPTTDSAIAGLSSAAGGHTPSGTISSTGGNETRPTNITVKWVILAVPSAFVAVAQVAPYFSLLTTDKTGTNDTSAQNVFLDGQSAFTSPGSSAYELDAFYFITRAAGTTSHTTSVLFGGTATISAILYTIESTTTTGAPTAATNSQMLVASAATATVAATTSTSGTENIVIRLKGTITVTGSGTIIPQFQYSVAPGGAPTIKAGSFIKLTPLGPNATTSYGPWS